MRVMGVYRDGVFVPDQRVDLPQGQTIRMEVEAVPNRRDVQAMPIREWLDTLPEIRFPEGWEFDRGSIYDDP